MELQKILNSQSNLEKKEQSYRIQNSWYWHKTRPIDQNNRLESPEINIYIYIDSKLLYDKGSNNIQ